MRTNRQTEDDADKQTDGGRCGQTDKCWEMRTNKQTEGDANKQTDGGDMDKQADGGRCKQTDARKRWLIG